MTAGHCVDPAMGRIDIIDSFLSEHNAAPDVVRDAEVNWKVEGLTTGSPVVANVQAIQPQGVDGATITTAATVQVVDFKPTDNGDVALLQLPNVTKETPPLIVANAAPQVGDAVTSIGFPGAMRDIADQSQLPRASFKSGSLSSQQVTPQGVTMLEVSDALSPGMSGGPTVNQDGRVVGINDKTDGDANFNLITDTPDLRAFLVSHGVALPQPVAPKSGISMLWYVIGGTGLVLGAVVLALILRRRKRHHAEAGDAASAQAAEEPAPAAIVTNGSPPVPVNDGQAAPVPVDSGQSAQTPSHFADHSLRDGVPSPS